MKVIVSHDVDHLYWREHWLRDLYIPKLILRNIIYAGKGIISGKSAIRRSNFLADKRMNRIKELMEFLKKMEIHSTFFFGMSSGNSLSYKFDEAIPYIKLVQECGHEVGLHGISSDSLSKLGEEKRRLEDILQNEVPGIRMHYLRQSSVRNEILGQLGFKYDSTEYKIHSPYLLNGLTYEFPISVMDAYALNANIQSLDKAKQYTLDRIEEAKKHEGTYFVINFHDPYFDESYKVYKDWFVWLIELLKKDGNEFITFSAALKSLSHEN